MLSIFSCADWPSEFLLWWKVYLGLLPIFYLFFGCWWWWVVWVFQLILFPLYSFLFLVWWFNFIFCFLLWGFNEFTVCFWFLKVKSLSLVQLFATHELHSSWSYLGQNTGVGSLSLLQGIFPTQGSNPGILHCRLILYQLSHQGSPSILKWVAYPFSRRSSGLRNWTPVSCFAGGFLLA